MLAFFFFFGKENCSSGSGKIATGRDSGQLFLDCVSGQDMENIPGNSQLELPEEDRHNDSISGNGNVGVGNSTCSYP